jgi:hypothetical protein
MNCSAAAFAVPQPARFEARTSRAHDPVRQRETPRSTKTQVIKMIRKQRQVIIISWSDLRHLITFASDRGLDALTGW